MFVSNPTRQPNGFVMRFANGYELSVQWGVGNYGSNRNTDVARDKPIVAVTAEVLLSWHSDIIEDGAGLFETKDGSAGWLTVEEVSKILYEVSLLEPRFSRVVYNKPEDADA